MDIQNFYIEQGEGFPIILLHGNGEDSSYFKTPIKKPSKTSDVIANLLSWGFVILVSIIGFIGLLLTLLYPFIS